MRKFLNNKKSKIMSKLYAFTLAEVLVTLGIIGVVSALTVPALMRNHQKTTYVTQLHKVYNEVSQAAQMVLTDSNAVSLKESRLKRSGIENFLRTYFKTTKVCLGGTADECFASEYANITGSTIRTRGIIGSTGVNNPSAAAILASGASIYIEYNGGSDDSGAEILYRVVTDVNGPQGPNILGRDLFDFILSSDGTASAGGDIETKAANFSSKCSDATSLNYGYCFAKIVNDGWKMDY